MLAGNEEFVDQQEDGRDPIATDSVPEEGSQQASTSKVSVLNSGSSDNLERGESQEEEGGKEEPISVLKCGGSDKERNKEEPISVLQVDNAKTTEALERHDADTAIRSSISRVQDSCGSDSDMCDANFICNNCGSNFPTKNLLKTHILQAHMNGKKITSKGISIPSNSRTSMKQLSLSGNHVASSRSIDDRVAQKSETLTVRIEGKLPKKVSDATSISHCNENAPSKRCRTDVCDSSDSTSGKVSGTVLESELAPTTMDEVRLIVEEKWEMICETSGKHPRINMENVKMKFPSGEFYGNGERINYKFLKPFISLLDSTYKCQICKNASFNIREGVLRHIGEHFKLQPYLCPFFCGKRTTLLSHANDHIRSIHVGQRVCEHCGGVYSAGHYPRHVLKHLKPYECGDCGRKYPSKDTLRNHIMKEHLKTRSYACNICGKSYFYKGNVQTHAVFAHAERKVVCDLCGKMYFRKNMLKEHMRRCHR